MKYSSRICVALTGAAALLWAAFATAAVNDMSDIECGQTAGQPCLVKETNLYLRLLVKPQSNIYFDMDENSAQVRSNVPAFSAYYAFEMHDVSFDSNFEATGWFRVGAAPDVMDGYMKASDVVPWKQALAVAFTNPGPSERKPVLMFGNQESLDLTLEQIEDGSLTAEKLYEDVLAGTKVDGIISRELNAWVDIDKNFYLMPILDHADLSFFTSSGDLRGVQVAALTNQARSQQAQACDISQGGGTDCIQQQSGSFDSTLGLNAIFVIDMTSSMQPYIDAVRDAVYGAAQSLSINIQDTSKLKLGLVGYRDSVEESPGIEFVTKNFTPELIPPDEFSELLSSGVVKASDVGSGDWEEDVFAGMKEAIEANWPEAGPRMIILIGDASAHAIDNAKNSVGMDERSIKELAGEKKVAVATIYVGKGGSTDLAAARPQFETMASGDESFISFAHVDPDGGGETSLEASLRDTIDKLVAYIAKGDFSEIMSSSVGGDDAAAQAMLGAARAAFVEYIGADAQVPTDIVAWALDRDPTDYQKKAFDIKVMVKKKDIEELMALLNGLMENLQGGKQTGSFVFGQIQSGATAASYDLGIGNTDTIASSKMVPQWVNALPYKSRILAMTLAEFQNAAPADRTEFEERITSLISLYGNELNRPDAWVSLNNDSPPEEKIYMLDLVNLP